MNFFITGCYRSGTTLIANFINGQTDSHALNQPAFDLFVLWKRLFYLHEQKDCKKWLGFGSPPVYNPSTFAQFLEKTKHGINELSLIQKEYFNILSTNGIENSLVMPKSISFYNLYDSLVRQIHARKPAFKSAYQLGSKEILCHEFVRYFISKNVRIVSVIRNPVDMIASLNFGTGKEYTGGARPTLLNLRNWREVAQTSLNLLNHKSIFVIKYEDFMQDVEVRSNLLQYLRIEPKELSIINLRDDNGNYWSGNTSFKAGDRPILDNRTVKYIESICAPEMRCLGYDSSVSRDDAISSIVNFKEPWDIASRDYYEVDYSVLSHHIEYELSILDRTVCHSH